MSGKKFLTPEVWENILTQSKSPIYPPPQKSNGQRHRGWGFDTLDVIRQQNGWRGFIMWWFSRLEFQDWKYANKRHKWKEKVQKNAQIPFCGQTRTFRYEIVFRGIQPCFLHGGSERLACSEPTDAERFLKKRELRSILYGQGKCVFKTEFLYLLKEQYPVTTHASNFDFWTGCNLYIYTYIYVWICKNMATEISLIYPLTESCSEVGGFFLFFFIVTFYLCNRYRIGHSG